MVRPSRRVLWVAWVLLALPLASYLVLLALQEHDWSTGILQEEVTKFEELGRGATPDMQKIMHEKDPAKLQRESDQKKNVYLLMSALLVTLPLTYPLAMATCVARQSRCEGRDNLDENRVAAS